MCSTADLDPKNACFFHRVDTNRFEPNIIGTTKQQHPDRRLNTETGVLFVDLEKISTPRDYELNPTSVFLSPSDTGFYQKTFQIE